MRFPKDLDKVVDKYLKIWYCILNRHCFHNKLPKDLEIASARVKGIRGGTWCTGTHIHGISVDPRDTDLISVLLHEMCHVYQVSVLGYGDGHSDHDHSFYQLEKVAKKRLDILHNKIYFPD